MLKASANTRTIAAILRLSGIFTLFFPIYTSPIWFIYGSSHTYYKRIKSSVPAVIEFFCLFLDYAQSDKIKLHAF